MAGTKEKEMERHEQSLEQSLGDVTFAAGYVTRYLEDYAASREISAVEFALRVADLILATQSGQVLGSEHYVSALRSAASQGSPAVAEMALAERTHRRSPSVSGSLLPTEPDGNGKGKNKSRFSAKGRKAIQRAQKKRWQRYHKANPKVTKAKKVDGRKSAWTPERRRQQGEKMRLMHTTGVLNSRGRRNAA